MPSVIKKLSSYAAKQKNSISRVKLSIKSKARLRIENKTRWSSEFMVLEAFHKGYLENIFGDYPCPVRFEAIEYYIQILLPALTFNLTMQRTGSSISDVLPTLMMILTKWRRMKVPPKYQVCLFFNNWYKCWDSLVLLP